MSGAAAGVAANLCLALLLALPATAQRGRGGDVPRNDPSTDPYTEGDPERMAAAGVVSLGGFEFGKSDTAGVDAWLATCDIRWIETEHFEIGVGLGPWRVKQKDKKRILAELERLAERLPEVDPKTKLVDPWLYAHLFAQRAEESYARFQELLGVTDADFPDGSAPWNGEGRYMGEGPYLGQKGKYEILLLPSEAASLSYLSHEFGLQIKRTQRWNVVDRETLTLTIHTQQGQLREDAALHGHVVFNLAHNFFDGYRHYSYDTPIWLHEGLAHWLERELNPEHNSFDGSEGAVAETTRKADWRPEVRKLVAAGDAPRMSALIRLNGYGEMELEDHFATWSMIDFLMRTRPDGLRKLIDGIKGVTNELGIPDGSNLPDRHRELFRDVLGWTYAQFDAAWAEWVLATY